MKRWTADFSAWVSSLRVSGVTVLAVVVLVLGAVMLSPNITTFVQQQRELSQLRASVEEHRTAVEEIDAERARWKDPAYVRSQARDRLLYVMPGETQLSVIDDVLIPAESDEETESTLTETKTNWAREFASTFLIAGMAEDPEQAATAGGETPQQDAPAEDTSAE